MCCTSLYCLPFLGQRTGASQRNPHRQPAGFIQRGVQLLQTVPERKTAIQSNYYYLHYCTITRDSIQTKHTYMAIWMYLAFVDLLCQ